MQGQTDRLTGTDGQTNRQTDGERTRAARKRGERGSYSSNWKASCGISYSDSAKHSSSSSHSGSYSSGCPRRQ